MARVVVAELGNEAGLIGAADLARMDTPVSSCRDRGAGPTTLRLASYNTRGLPRRPARGGARRPGRRAGRAVPAGGAAAAARGATRARLRGRVRPDLGRRPPRQRRDDGPHRPAVTPSPSTTTGCRSCPACAPGATPSPGSPSRPAAGHRRQRPPQPLAGPAGPARAGGCSAPSSPAGRRAHPRRRRPQRGSRRGGVRRPRGHHRLATGGIPTFPRVGPDKPLDVVLASPDLVVHPGSRSTSTRTTSARRATTDPCGSRSRSSRGRAEPHPVVVLVALERLTQDEQDEKARRSWRSPRP